MAYSSVTAGGIEFASDLISGRHLIRYKLSFGSEGSVTDVSAANPMPITSGTPLAVTGTFWPSTQPVSVAALPLPSGAATAANQIATTAAVQALSAASSWFAITPADANLTTIPASLYVSVSGDLVVRGADGLDATFAVFAGQVVPIRPAQVRTGTTATVIGLIV